MKDIKNIKSISQVHRLLGFSPPKHPLITLLDYSKMNIPSEMYNQHYSFEFYSISLKDFDCGLQYGRNHYDFEEGVLMFTAPNQVMLSERNHNEAETAIDGWVLYFHPDLIRATNLGKIIHQYNFFSYDVNEALHLSEKEKQILTNCVESIEYEYSQNIDNHSQTILVNNIELLLNYCVRFFERQFNTRTSRNKDIVTQFESILTDYFNADLAEKGLPTVQYCAEQVHLSPNYLSDLLKKETGKTAQEHIHLMIIDTAKNRLLNSNDSIKEIAYNLGFEYPHYFSRIFKSKTGYSPNSYRNLN